MALMGSAHIVSGNLTICTVSFSSARWLELNLALTRKLNPRASFDWVVAENSTSSADDAIDFKHREFRVVKGAAPVTSRYAAASYHHAAGLKQALQEVRTRFLLVLDPDFYIIRPGWISEVLEYMRRNEVAILGAPWHPSRPSKFRYFPCAHCTFYDLEKVRLSTLDFAPDYESVPEWVDKKETDKSQPGQKLVSYLTFGKRRGIGKSRDTGWKIYAIYHGDPTIKVECLTPVFSPRTGKRIKDFIFPDSLSMVPKRPGYYTRRDFRDYGLKREAHPHWECFFWQGRPFGFHVRCHPLVKGGDNKSALEQHLLQTQQFLDVL